MAQPEPHWTPAGLAAELDALSAALDALDASGYTPEELTQLQLQIHQCERELDRHDPRQPEPRQRTLVEFLRDKKAKRGAESKPPRQQYVPSTAAERRGVERMRALERLHERDSTHFQSGALLTAQQSALDATAAGSYQHALRHRGEAAHEERRLRAIRLRARDRRRQRHRHERTRWARSLSPARRPCDRRPRARHRREGSSRPRASRAGPDGTASGDGEPHPQPGAEHKRVTQATGAGFTGRSRRRLGASSVVACGVPLGAVA
jgi:hypothetical protein